MKTWISLAMLACVTSASLAQVIGDRATLNSLLTGSTTDDFERFDIGDGNAESLDVFSLDLTTITEGQGPGLVNPGATYSDTSSIQLQWNGNGYFDLTTKTLLANGADGTLRIDYAGFTQAMGLDVENFSTFGYDGVLEVYNGATLIDSVDFVMNGGAGESMFLGYQNAAGITHVLVRDLDHSWSAIIDDHTYGVVPEPLTMTTLAVGVAAMLRRRRK